MIWVDADATPRAVKEMLYRAADRRKVEVVFVANQAMLHPRSPWIRSVVVGRGFDIADEHIASHAGPGDLVISADIPLAAKVVAAGAVCVDPRGEVIDAGNAAARLQMRDFAETIRESGEVLAGPKPFSDRDKRRFAAVLDRWLATGRVA